MLDRPRPHRALRRGRLAVDDVSLDLPDRRGAGGARPVRLRQVHAAAGGRRPGAARRRQRLATTAQDLAAVPTHRRGFALMFQDGQLFPHQTVAGNVGYPLRLRRTAADQVRAAGRGAARAGRPPGVRRPQHHAPVRRRAAAGRPGPGAGRRAAAAAARRAAVRARPRPARAARPRPARHPGRRRHDGPARHPRPGGGVRGRRPDGADARRPAGPGRHRRGGLAARRWTPRRPGSSATPPSSTAEPRPAW